LLVFARGEGYNYSMLRTVFGGLAAVAVSLAFLACDGPLPGYYAEEPGGEELLLRGRVYWEEGEGDNKVQKPIKGISVYVKGVTDNYAYLTNAKGEFFFPVPKRAKYEIWFTDIDDEVNDGLFKQKNIEEVQLRVEKSSKDPITVAMQKESD